LRKLATAPALFSSLPAAQQDFLAAMTDQEQQQFLLAPASVQQATAGFMLSPPPTPVPPTSAPGTSKPTSTVSDSERYVTVLIESLPADHQATLEAMSSEQQQQFFAAPAAVQLQATGFSLPPTPAPPTDAPASSGGGDIAALISSLPASQQAILGGMSSDQQQQFIAAGAAVQLSSAGFSLPPTPAAPTAAPVPASGGAAVSADVHMKAFIASLPASDQAVLGMMSSDQQQMFMAAPPSIQIAQAGFSLPPTPAGPTPGPPTPAPKTSAPTPSTVITRAATIAKLPAWQQVAVSGCFSDNKTSGKGRYYSVLGSTRNGQDLGTKCPAGKHQGEDRFHVEKCEMCQKGYYQPDEGATSCKKCPYGLWSNHTGALECHYCPYGQMITKEVDHCFDVKTRLNDKNVTVLAEPGSVPPGAPFGMPADVIGSLASLPNLGELMGLMDAFKSGCHVCEAYPCDRIEEIVLHIGIEPSGILFSPATVVDTIGTCIMCGSDPDDETKCGFADPVKSAERWAMCDPLCAFNECFEVRDGIKDHLRVQYGLPAVFTEFLANQIVTPLCYGCDGNSACQLQHEIFLAEQEEKADGLMPIEHDPTTNSVIEDDQAIIDAMEAETGHENDAFAILVTLPLEQQELIGNLPANEQEDFYSATPEEQDIFLGFSLPPTAAPKGNEVSALRLADIDMMETDLTYSTHKILDAIPEAEKNIIWEMPLADQEEFFISTPEQQVVLAGFSIPPTPQVVAAPSFAPTLSHHCFDGRLDYGETDVDCGHECEGCLLDQLCVDHSDCTGVLICSKHSTCTAPPLDVKVQSLVSDAAAQLEDLEKVLNSTDATKALSDLEKTIDQAVQSSTEANSSTEAQSTTAASEQLVSSAIELQGERGDEGERGGEVAVADVSTDWMTPVAICTAAGIGSVLGAAALLVQRVRSSASSTRDQPPIVDSGAGQEQRRGDVSEGLRIMSRLWSKQNGQGQVERGEDPLSCAPALPSTSVLTTWSDV
jgi:hypothetical protein